MKITFTGREPYPGQWIAVDQEDYIVERVEYGLDAPRRLVEMGGGPYGEPVAMRSEYIVTLRPITDSEEAERRRLSDELRAPKPWWKVFA